MALQQSRTIKGKVYPAAYIKVMRVTVNNQNILYTLFIWGCQADKVAKKRPLQVEKGKFAFDPNATVNAIKQTYTYLKTLPEFAGASDV